MKENKQTEIATNVSSGAEKVETIQKTVQQKDDNKGVAVKKTVKKTNTQPKKSTEKSEVAKKTEKENKKANARVERAIKKKEEKKKRKAEKVAQEKKRKAERKARLEKRVAERKAREQKRQAEKQARIEKKRAEREQKQREHAHKKANRAQRKSKEKANKDKEKGNRVKGYGGWLATVIALGTVTLALGTTVTLGAIEMKKMNDTAMTGYRATTYEIAGIMENIDNDLDRARLATTPSQQDRILTDLLVQARLAELDLEKMPISAEKDAHITSFINGIARASERMLFKLRSGEKLSESDYEILEKLYEINHTVRTQLNEYIANMQEGDMMEFVKKGSGKMSAVLENLEGLTLEENRAPWLNGNPQMQGAGTNSSQKEDSPSQMNAKGAEEACARYFADYKIAQFQCVGETATKGYKAFNVQGYDENGTMLFAEIDSRNGALLRFDYFEPCEESTMSVDSVKVVAEEFLQKLGYEDMTAVRVRENGTDIDFTFAYQKDGVVYYPDSVKIKVCRSRGVVTGLDSHSYIQHHTLRQEPTVSVTLESAQGKLRNGVEVLSSKLAVIRTARGERTAYEFLCAYKGEKYFIYTDANTGNELAIVNIKNIG